MRVTASMLFNNVVRGFQRSFRDIMGVQERLASGKRFSRPSEDVLGMARSMDYRISINANEQFGRNINEAYSQLEYADQKMGSVVSTIQRAQELAMRGVTGTMDADGRSAIAVEVAELRDHLLFLSNSTFRGRYVFAGFRVDRAAYDSASYAYKGDRGLMNVMIDAEESVAVNVAGESLFSYGLSAPEVVDVGGRYFHYTQGQGTTINVEIRDSDDTTVLDAFSFDNAIQMTDILARALTDNDVDRARAIMDPLERASSRVIDARAEVGSRLNRLDDQMERLKDGALSLRAALSNVEDADLAQSSVDLSRAEVALQALRDSSSRIISQSLMDYIK